MNLGPLLAIPVAAAAQPGGANLIPNPSFEDGDSTPTAWDALAWGGAQLTRDSAVAHSGEASARIVVTAEGAHEYPSFRYVLQGARVGEEYGGSAWVRTEGATDIGGFIVIGFYRGEERLSFAQGPNTGPGTHEWTEFKLRALVPMNCDAVTLGLAVHGEGTVWFDDTRLVRTEDAPPGFEGEAVTLRVRPRRVITRPFLGFGAQGDYLLTRGINTSRGVTDEDRKLILERVAEMRPHIIRTFFDYRWWEPEEGKQTPDSEAMRDYIGWARFLQGIDCAVLLNPWGDFFAYPDWMGAGTARLPAPGKRESMVRSLVDCIERLHRREGLTNVQYVCLMNEPDNDRNRTFPAEEFVRLSRMLDAMLEERGLRESVSLLTSDDSWGGQSEAGDWFREVAALGLDYCDGFSTHTYRHDYAPGLVPWLSDRRRVLRQANAGKPFPLLITEFGHGGETYTNRENHKYEYGLFLGEFAITALREGASAALMWCLGDTCYTDSDEHCQEWGLWRYKDEGWEPRPGFYAWSLVTRYTRAESRVVAVDVRPAAHDVRAVALVSPEGKLTVMAVNRYPREIAATIRPGLKRGAQLDAYEYTRESVPTEDHGMLRAAERITTKAGGALTITLPAGSFVVLTELE